MTKQFVERLIDALPEEWQEEVKKVFDHGATKHKTVQPVMEQIGHALCHWSCGPGFDRDSGCNMTAHAIARLMLALTRCINEPFEWKPKQDTLDIVAEVSKYLEKQNCFRCRYFTCIPPLGEGPPVSKNSGWCQRDNGIDLRPVRITDADLEKTCWTKKA